MAIRLVDGETLLEQVQWLLTGKRELPGAAEYPGVAGAIDLSLKEAWRQEWWNELLKCEERYFRANWLAGSTYNKTNEVYDAATQQYFQCLRDAVTGAGNSPTDSAGVERSSHWAKCLTTYGGPNWSAASVSYAVGDKVRYPVTNRHYQCHTAHVSSGTLTPDATGGNERWGILTPFERYVDKDAPGQTVIGDVFDVKDRNPRVDVRWSGLRWGTFENRVYVQDEVVRCWIEFRLKPPRIFGGLYDAALAYTAGVDQVYWDNAGAIPGNWYDCITTTTPGQNPTNTGAKWRRVEIPELLEGAVIWSAYGKTLTGEDRLDRKAEALEMGAGYLELEADNVYRQQGQAPNMSVRTY